MRRTDTTRGPRMRVVTDKVGLLSARLAEIYRSLLVWR
jgi:hypothetical protein